jgi:hypothetical protein
MKTRHIRSSSLCALGTLILFFQGCGTVQPGTGAGGQQSAAPASWQTTETLWESFDTESGWTSAKGAVSTSLTELGRIEAKVISSVHTEGTGALEADLEITGTATALFFRDLDPAEDWSKIDGLEVDIVNRCAARLLVSFFVETGADRRMQSTSAFSVTAGSSGTLFFDFVNGLFRTGQGHGVAPLVGADSVRRVGFAITGLENPAGSVLFDNLRLIEGRGTAAPAPGAVGGQGGGISFLSIQENRNSLPVYGRFELDAALSFQPKNPYDPDEFSLDARFTAPSGKSFVVPAFWYIPFSREQRGSQAVIRPSGPGNWKVRFTPNETGRWKYRLVAGAAESDERSFESLPGDDGGYVRVSPRDGHYFEFERGGTFFPIGSNVAWYDQRGISAYDLWFGKMSGEGANYARLWFASWGFAQEWSDTGLGNYTARQRQAWEMDYVVDLAEQKGIYLMLCLLYHGAWSYGTNPEWDSNPYNAAAGGFLDAPAKFLSDPRAKKLFAQRLRYIVSRWGYSTHVFSWELWNEANLASGMISDPAWAPWLKETADEIRAMDFSRHMVSNSYNIDIAGDDPVWQPMDFVQTHAYSLFDWSSYIKRVTEDVRTHTDKPYFFGEFGISGGVPDWMGVHMHDGLWAGFFSGNAATAMLWWWDQYIEGNNLWGQYGTISDFLKSEDLAGYGLAAVPVEKKPGIRIYRLSGPDRTFVWIKDLHYTFQGFQDLAMEQGLENVVFPTIDGFEWQVPVESRPGTSGNWRVQLWDTQKGVIVSEQTMAAVDGALTIQVPSFSMDLAYKIIRK